MLLSQAYRSPWSNISKLVFRFLCLYFTLYVVLTFTASFFETPFKWIGSKVLGITYDYSTNGQGSGDTTFAYVTTFVNFCLAFLFFIVWSVLDRKRPSYNKLFYWFLVLLRVTLVLAMLLYGLVKIFKVQFPSASLTRLLEPLGNFSPMGLAWTYMGYSKGFNVFVGFMEVLGGLLLIPRRTQTIGAFIVMGVMTQVAMMNLFFDIPVKLFSIHLVLMALVIFMTDIKRFTNVFIKNKAVTEYEYYHPVKDKTYHKAIFWIKTIGLVAVVSLMSVNFYSVEQSRGDYQDKPFLYGIWEVKLFIKNNDTLPPLITDDKRWRYLIIDGNNRTTVKTMDDKKHRFTFKPDTTVKKVSVFKTSNADETLNFIYKHPNSETLILQGVMENDSLYISFERLDHTSFKLKSQKFRWINEYPDNQ